MDSKILTILKRHYFFITMVLFKSLFIRLLFLLCTFSIYSTEPVISSHDTAQQEVWLTIFVHGIINIKPHLSFSNIIRFMTDQITDSVYARAIEIIRNDPFFYQYYAMQGLGLQKIELEHYKEGNAAAAFAISYKEFTNLTSIKQNNIFYTFGWSGLLSTQVRYQEAIIFFEQLKTEVERYHAQGINPKIRIIGYSHGGYIALNLGAVFNNLKESYQNWLVDELILIGVPVISDTDFLVSSKLFKRVYHFYSPADRVQVVDCLATNRFFSHRIFSSRFGFFLPDNLIQIQFRCKRIARLNRAQKQCKTHTAVPIKLLRNADPGHTELWSFGWTSGYRTYLPFYPFPAGAYLSYIVNTINEHNIQDKHLVIDIRPFQNEMIISTLSYDKKVVASFPSAEHHKNIFSQIESFIPKNCSKALYTTKAQHALTTASLQKNEEWKQKRTIARSKNLKK